MQNLFLILSTPFILYLTFIRPFQTEKINRGTVKHPNPRFRLLFYRRSTKFKVYSSAYVIAIMAFTGQSLHALLKISGSASLIPSGFWLPILVLVLELLVITELLNRFSGLRHFLLIGDVDVILPRNNRERLWWVPTAIAAGIGEELVYRSFMIYFFMHLPVHLNVTEALICSSILFGFAHIYQGVFGVAGTGVAGYLLGSLFVSYGAPAVMIIHALIDLRVALLAPPRQRRRKLAMMRT